jgi:3-deoxy-D-manno-octulosonic-acid transferase
MKKVLIFRLSSLGDVVLSTAALSVPRLAPGADGKFVDWVVSAEFAPLLEGHPGIRRVIPFDRKGGLGAWLELCRALFKEGYGEVIDLHSSLRTRLARLLFFVWTRSRSAEKVEWRALPKQHWRLYGMYCLKVLWPKAFRPTPLVERLARTAGGTGKERPELSHLVDAEELDRLRIGELSQGKATLCVMPGARWPGKQWSPRRFLDVIRRVSAYPIVLGTERDEASLWLAGALAHEKIPHFVAWGEHASFRRTAALLSTSQLYLGSDTGLAHLAEAVGARSITLFGPTVPAMGFGPWREKSRAVGASLWCRPCGKDGRFCFRLSKRHLCQSLLMPEDVLIALGLQALPGKPPEERVLPRLVSPALSRTWLGRVYLWILLHVLWRWVLPRKFSRHRIDSRFGPRSLGEGETHAAGVPIRRCWFHAASAGELESLWTVILKASRIFDEVLVTGFSESVGERLHRLNAALAQSGKPARWVGYSPCEGEWHEALLAVKPALFVTAKYEAWPELWMSLAEQRIPLAIVGAQSRRSLKVAKWACRALGGKLPELHLLTARTEEGAPLEQLFPDAEVKSTGDPRWDRVQSRAAAGSARARELVGLFEGWPRPWGVLGQIWDEDLKAWASELKGVRGTLWIVPHKIDGPQIASLEELLTEAGVSALRTSKLVGPERVPHRENCVILGDELGFLSELYSAVDWAYVGGGFTAGIHSTIEPAIHGIPLASGPKNAGNFPEIAELRQTGQLRIVNGVKEIRDWHAYALSVAQATGAEASAGPDAWKQQALSRLGSTDRVMQALAAAAKIVVR